MIETPLTRPESVLTELIRRPSVTPQDAGALEVLGAMLARLGFSVETVTFSDNDTPDITNLYATLRRGNGAHLMFAGHTDVVPPGNENAWRHPPFSAAVEQGRLYGRGAVDMKGGIAAFVSGLARAMESGWRPNGAISLLITGDEEGPAINGTVKLLDWATAKGERWDAAIVGEPTNPDEIGDAIKIGRRGSLSGILTVKGRQGHVAYPHLADNPARTITALCAGLMREPLDLGSEAFQPTNLEVTSIDIGNAAVNIIPDAARAMFNIRFNDHWTVETLKAELLARLERAAVDPSLRGHNPERPDWSVVWKERPSDVFLTRDDRLIETLGASVEKVCGRRPSLSTGGGTSDARFIKDHCPVVEFGLVGQTMHMVDEHVRLSDLEMLTEIYRQFVVDWFDAS